MARYYRRRYTRVVRPKKKWASNIALFFDNDPVPFANGIAHTTLVKNPAQSSNPTPSIVKTGNFKVSIDSLVTYPSGTTETANAVFQFFIAYVPEGWVQTDLNGLITSHPEWILASKTAGGSYAVGATHFSLDTVNFSSRLKRNLNSGDSIQLLVTSNTQASSQIRFNGHVRYWTCAN